jgi:hypothetical protein
VIREGAALERAFLLALREKRSKQLQYQIEEQRAESSDQAGAAPKRSNSEIKRLRTDIERIDRRLTMLETEAPALSSPDRN